MRASLPAGLSCPSSPRRCCARAHTLRAGGQGCRTWRWESWRTRSSTSLSPSRSPLPPPHPPVLKGHVSSFPPVLTGRVSAPPHPREFSIVFIIFMVLIILIIFFFVSDEIARHVSDERERHVSDARESGVSAVGRGRRYGDLLQQPRTRPPPHGALRGRPPAPEFLKWLQTLLQASPRFLQNVKSLTAAVSCRQ